MPNWQVPVPSGKIESCVMGTDIVIPLKIKLMVSVVEGLQGKKAEVGSVLEAVAPTKAQIDRTSAAGS